MSDESLNKFIDGLSEGLEPVKPLAHPLARMAPLMVVCIVYVCAMIMMIGPRQDFVPKMIHEIDYAFEILLSIGIFISSAIALGWMSIPDMRGQTWIKAVPVTLSGVFVLWAVLRIYFEWGEPLVFKLQNCSMDGFFMTFLPVAALVFASRQGTTTQPRWTAIITVLSFSGLGWAGLRFTCAAGTFMQSFVIHFIPFIIMGVIIGVFARRIFRW